MALLPAVIKRDIERISFQTYVTDALKAVAEHTAVTAGFVSAGKHGMVMSRRWGDFDKPKDPEETRTPKEVVKQMLTLLRGKKHSPKG